jgi:hypothetical protein
MFTPDRRGLHLSLLDPVAARSGLEEEVVAALDRVADAWGGGLCLTLTF